MRRTLFALFLALALVSNASAAGLFGGASLFEPRALTGSTLSVTGAATVGALDVGAGIRTGMNKGIGIGTPAPDVGALDFITTVSGFPGAGIGRITLTGSTFYLLAGTNAYGNLVSGRLDCDYIRSRASGSDVRVALDDHAGVYGLSIEDDEANEVASINSDGDLLARAATFGPSNGVTISSAGTITTTGGVTVGNGELNGSAAALALKVNGSARLTLGPAGGTTYLVGEWSHSGNYVGTGTGGFMSNDQGRFGVLLDEAGSGPPTLTYGGIVGSAGTMSNTSATATLSSGTAAITAGWTAIQSEDTNPDTVTNLTGAANGGRYIFTLPVGSPAITFDNTGTGAGRFAIPANFTLDDPADILECFYNGNIGAFCQVSASDNG